MSYENMEKNIKMMLPPSSKIFLELVTKHTIREMQVLAIEKGQPFNRPSLPDLTGLGSLDSIPAPFDLSPLAGITYLLANLNTLDDEGRKALAILAGCFHPEFQESDFLRRKIGLILRRMQHQRRLIYDGALTKLLICIFYGGPMPIRDVQYHQGLRGLLTKGEKRNRNNATHEFLFIHELRELRNKFINAEPATARVINQSVKNAVIWEQRQFKIPHRMNAPDEYELHLEAFRQELD